MGNKQVNSVCMMESLYFFHFHHHFIKLIFTKQIYKLTQPVYYFVSMEFYVKFGRTTKIMLSEKQAVGKVVQDIFQVLSYFHVF